MVEQGCPYHSQPQSEVTPEQQETLAAQEIVPGPIEQAFDQALLELPQGARSGRISPLWMDTLLRTIVLINLREVDHREEEWEGVKKHLPFRGQKSVELREAYTGRMANGDNLEHHYIRTLMETVKNFGDIATLDLSRGYYVIASEAMIIMEDQAKLGNISPFEVKHCVALSAGISEILRIPEWFKDKELPSAQGAVNAAVEILRTKVGTMPDIAGLMARWQSGEITMEQFHEELRESTLAARQPLSGSTGLDSIRRKKGKLYSCSADIEHIDSFFKKMTVAFVLLRKIQLAVQKAQNQQFK